MVLPMEENMDSTKKIGSNEVENGSIVQELVEQTIHNLNATISNNTLTSAELKEHLKAHFDLTLKQFFAFRDAAAPRQWEKFKTLLISELKIAYRDLCLDFTNRYSGNLTDAVLSFRSQVEARVDSKCFTLEKLQNVFSYVKTAVIKEFENSMPDLEQLSNRLDEESLFFISENKNRLDELDRVFNSISPELLKTYKDKVEDELPDDELENASDQKLESVFQKISRKVLKKLNEHMTFDVPEIKEKFEGRMIVIMREQFSEKLRTSKSQKERKLVDAGAIVTNAVEGFAESMMVLFENNSDDSTINNFRNEKGKDLMMSLTEEIYAFVPDHKVAKQILKTAKAEMENIYQEMKSQRQEQLQTFQKRWEIEIKSICGEFQNKMNEFSNTNILPDMDELQQNLDILINELIRKSKSSWLDERKDLVKSFHDAAREQMKRLSIPIFESFGKMLDNNFEWQKLAMNQCLEAHELKVKEILKGELNDEAVIRARRVGIATLEQFEIQAKNAVPTSLSATTKLKGDLKQVIDEYHSQFERQLQDRILMAKAEVSQLVTDADNDYKLLMNAFVIASNYGKEKIPQIHANLKNRALQNLQKSLNLRKFSGNVKEMLRKLENTIETSYNDIKVGVDSQCADSNKKLESCNQKASNHYKQLFNSSMGIVSNEDDLKDIHKDLKEQAIAIWEESFPIDYFGDILLPERRKFAKQLDHEFDTTILGTWQEINLDIDRNTKSAIEVLVKNYEEQMNQALNRFDFISTDMILSNNEKFLKKAKKDLNNVNKPKNISKKTYDDLLLTRLANTLDCFKSQNTQKESNTRIELCNKVNNLKEPIRRDLFDLKVLPEIPALFNTYRGRVQVLMNQYKIPRDCQKELVSYVDEILMEIIRDVAAEWDKTQPDSNELQLAINLAVEEYNKEMDNRTLKKGQIFKASAMKAHHTHSLHIVQKKFQERLRQTSASREQFNQAINAVLKKFEELNDLKASEYSDAAVGIDLGTTNSCVAIYRGQEIEMIPDRYNQSKMIVPSYVLYETATKTVVGHSAKIQSFLYPENTIFDSKRLIGRKFEDDQIQKDIALWPFKVVEDPDRKRKEPKIEVHNSFLHPEEVSGEILKYLKENAEVYLGREVKNVVISVPATFNDAQKRATKNAAAFANMNVLEIINEPTSAAVAYSLQYTDGKSRNILVFDLGGGTFDVSVLSTENKNIVVKAVDGDNHLGGEDFDSNLVDFCIEKFRQKTGLNIPKNEKRSVTAVAGVDVEVDEPRNTLGALRRLRQQCEQQKINLTTTDKVRVSVDCIYNQNNLDVEVTVEDFNEMNKLLFNKCIETVKRTVEASKLTKEQIDSVVLVGGSSRIPEVQRLLSAFFNGKSLIMSINPDEVVAQGAAYRAAMISGSKSRELEGIKFQDVNPLSLGVEVIGGRFSIIIPKNTQLPTKRTETYVTTTDYQTKILFSIYEGDNSEVKNNNLLGEFTLSNIPSKQRGKEPVEVTIECDDEGLIHVTAQVKSNDNTANIKIISNRGGLTEEEIDKAKSKNTTP